METGFKTVGRGREDPVLLPGTEEEKKPVGTFTWVARRWSCVDLSVLTLLH